MNLDELDELRELEYLKRLEVNALRREVYAQPSPAAATTPIDILYRREAELSEFTSHRVRAEAEAAAEQAANEVRGTWSTGLEVDIDLRLAHVPTAIYHLLDPAERPLVSCRVCNTRDMSGARRVRVTSFIEGYSARAIDTVELESLQEQTLHQLPTLFPDRTQALRELTGATLNVLVEDLDGKVEIHQTKPVRLLARTTASLAVLDPSTGLWTDLSRYLGAFVTPNAPTIMTFLRIVTEHHPDRRLVGYQDRPSSVEPQVKAVFEALRATGVSYVNSVIAFSPEDGVTNQRIRLPRESLTDREANCVDGTVLMASLLEAMSLSPAIVVVPGHALLAWETWYRSDDWRYLETTMIGSATFEEACATAERTVAGYRQLAGDSGDPFHFRQWPVRKLRSIHRITPME